jgi:glycosyltransferase involved in cell wall biosynthesis
MFYHLIVFPFLLRTHKVVRLFSPLTFFPFFFSSNVVVIHDVAYLRFKNETRLLQRKLMQWVYACAAKRAQSVVVPSAFVQEEFLKHFPHSTKVTVVPEGTPTLASCTQIETDQFLSSKDIRIPYLLYIGSDRPRKNVSRLVAGFLSSQTARTHTLVLAGAFSASFGNPRIRQIGSVTEPEKTMLYRNAFAFMFPSYYEGFGLPVLEAQSVGVPVIAARAASLPEVAGSGAYYFDPYDPEDITRALDTVCASDSLRTTLRAHGAHNLERFSWSASARAIAEILCDDL